MTSQKHSSQLQKPQTAQVSNARVRSSTYLDSILPLREMRRLLFLLFRHDRALVLTQPPPDRAGLLGAQVEGEVFLLLVEEAELLALVRVDDGEDAGD